MLMYKRNFFEMQEILVYKSKDYKFKLPCNVAGVTCKVTSDIRD